MIFHTTHFIPSNAAGCMRVFLIPIILIRPQYKDDAGLLAHECKHSDQAYAMIFPPIYALRYALSKSYRLKCEVEAYREQLRVNALVNFNGGMDYTLTYAGFIADHYGLDVNVADVVEMLK